MESVSRMWLMMMMMMMYYCERPTGDIKGSESERECLLKNARKRAKTGIL